MGACFGRKSSPVVNIVSSEGDADTPRSSIHSDSKHSAWSDELTDATKKVANLKKSSEKKPLTIENRSMTLNNSGVLPNDWVVPDASTHKRVLCKVPHIGQQDVDMSVLASACICLHFYGHRLDQYYVKMIASGFDRENDSVVKQDPINNMRWLQDLVTNLNQLCGYNWNQNVYHTHDMSGRGGFHDGIKNIITSLENKKPVLIDTTIYDGHCLVIAGYIKEHGSTDPFPSFICVDPSLPFPGRRFFEAEQLFHIWKSPKVIPPERSNGVRLATFTCARGMQPAVKHLYIGRPVFSNTTDSDGTNTTNTPADSPPISGRGQRNHESAPMTSRKHHDRHHYDGPKTSRRHHDEDGTVTSRRHRDHNVPQSKITISQQDVPNTEYVEKKKKKKKKKDKEQGHTKELKKVKKLKHRSIKNAPSLQIDPNIFAKKPVLGTPLLENNANNDNKDNENTPPITEIDSKHINMPNTIHSQNSTPPEPAELELDYTLSEQTSNYPDEQEAELEVDNTISQVIEEKKDKKKYRQNNKKPRK